MLSDLVNVRLDQALVHELGVLLTDMGDGAHWVELNEAKGWLVDFGMLVLHLLEFEDV